MRPYYEDDSVTIYHGDSREVLPAISADVLVTDPPYGVNLGGHGGADEKRKAHVLVKGSYATYDDTPENFDTIIVPVIKAALAATLRGLVFCAGHMAWRLPVPAAVGGVYLPAACGRTAWGYNSFAHCLLYGTAPDLHKGAKPIGFKSTETARDIDHPCPKPLGWMHWAVALASRDDEVILDPFMGSGTTLRAAKDHGRCAIGIEIEERYCEIAAERMGQEVLC